MAYTRLQRSLNARKQLRDRRGRWIFMGGGLKFRHGGKDRRGRITGVNGDYVDIETVNPDTGRTETLRKHRSEVESDGSKASLSQARSRSRARRSDANPPQSLHNDDTSLERRLNQIGVRSDDARAITRANSREEAEDAWNRSEQGQRADNLYADIKDKPALSAQEKAFKTRYENTKNEIAERFQTDPEGIYEDGLGNYSIPKSQIEAKELRDIEPGDRILGKGERNSPEMSKTGDRDKTTGEVLEVTDKSRDDSGRTTLKVRDEEGNEREYTYSRRALDNTRFAPASSLYDPDSGDDGDEADLPGGVDAPDTMNDISSWETVDPNERGDGPIRMRDPETGEEYFVKIPDDNEQAKNDDLAARLYDEAGIRSATQEQVRLGDSGRLATASPAIPDAKEDLRERIEAGDKEYLDDLREGFAIDAWLGNTNPGGEYNENIMSDSNGQPVRVSQSGALLFDENDRERALKNSVTEWNSMRRKGAPSADLYRDMSPEQLKESARRVASISDEDIDRIVDSVDLPESTATPLKETLKKRRDDIKKRAGIDKEEAREEAPRQEGSEAQRPARTQRERAQDAPEAQESDETPADEDTDAPEPSSDESGEPSEDDLSSGEDVDEELQEVVDNTLELLNDIRVGRQAESPNGERFTKTGTDSWEDEQGNEWTSEELANSFARDVLDSDDTEPLSEHQQDQASKASDRPVGGKVTDDDGDSYTKNEDGEWVRDDTGDLIGSDEDLARYVGDQSLNVDENNPDNFPFNPNVVDTRNYRPTDENGIPRDRTPEESEALQRAKDAQPGDVFVDDDGDEYVKHENDKWTQEGESLEDGGYNNSEAFLSKIGPWNPRPVDSEETVTEAEPDVTDSGQERGFRPITQGWDSDGPSKEDYDLVDEPVSDYLSADRVYRSKDGEVVLNKDDYGWQVWTKADNPSAFQPRSTGNRSGRVNGATAEKIGDDVYVHRAGGSQFDDADIRDQDAVTREVKHAREDKKRQDNQRRKIDEEIQQGKDRQQAELREKSPSQVTEDTFRDLMAPLGRTYEGDTLYDKKTGKEYRLDKIESEPGNSRVSDTWTLTDTSTGRSKKESSADAKKKYASQSQEKARQAIEDATPLKPGEDTLPEPSEVSSAPNGTRYSRYNQPFLVQDPDGQRHLITGVRENPGDSPDIESITIGKNGRALGTKRYPHRDTERAIVQSVEDAVQRERSNRQESLTPTDEDGLIDQEEMRKRLSDMEDGAEVRTEGGDEYRKEDGIWTNTETGEQVDGGGLVDRHEAEEIERIDPLEDEPHAQRISELDNLEEGTVVEFEDGERYTKKDGGWVGEDGNSEYDSAMLVEKHEAQDFTPSAPQDEELAQRTPPTESQGRITDPAELDSRPEGSRIQISQNNRTRIAEKGEDGKWRDEETGRVIAKPIPKNSNVTDLPEGTPEVDQNIGGDRDAILDGLNSLPSGSRVDIRQDRSEGTKSHRKNDDGTWTDEDGNTRETDEIADNVPEDVIVDRIGSTPAQDQAESGDREIPGQGDLFDSPDLTDESRDERKDSDSEAPEESPEAEEDAESEETSTPERGETPDSPDRTERENDLADAKPGDSIASEDGDFFTKDDDGNWFDIAGEELTDTQLERRLRGKEYEKIGQDDENAPESREDDSDRPEGAEDTPEPSEERTDIPEPTDEDSAPEPEAEDAEAPDTEVPEQVQEEMEEAVEAFDPNDPETQENIAALDAMPRGTQISGEGVSFTKMVKYWKQDDYPEDAPKSGNRYTSEDVLFNVDINDALVSTPEPARPKERKAAPETPETPAGPTPVQVDEFGNEFIDNGSGKPHFKGDTVNVGGRSPIVGVIDSFSPDGSMVKVRDNKDGRIKTKKSSDISQIKNDDDAPDVSGQDSERLSNLPAGTKLNNDDLAPTGDYLEKRPDGVWERRDLEGRPVGEYSDDDLRSADWNFFDKKASDDRRNKFEKEREREQREEDRIRRREEREEEKRRNAEDRAEEKAMRDLLREEEKRRAAEEKQLTKEIEDFLKEEDRKRREEEKNRDRNAREDRIVEERREREERRRELEALKRDIIERDREQRKKERDEAKEKRDKEREEARRKRDEERERDRERRERERRRRERDREARRRKEDDEDEKKKKKRRKRRDMDGGFPDGFPGGWPGGLPLPGLPSSKKPKKPKKSKGRGGGSPSGGSGRGGARPEGTTPRRPGAEEPTTPDIPSVEPTVPADVPGTEDDLRPDTGPEDRIGLPTPSPESDSDIDGTGDSLRQGDDVDRDSSGRDLEGVERDNLTGVSDSDLPADQSRREDSSLAQVGTQLTTPSDLSAAPTGTMIARPNEYNEPFRKTEDGTWANTRTGDEIATEDLSGIGEGPWDVVDSGVAGVLLDDDEAFSNAPAGAVVIPTENSPAAEMDVAQFQKQADGTWQPQDAVGEPISGESIRPEAASIRIGPAIVDSAPQTGISSDSDSDGFMRLLGESREQINEVSAPMDTPETDHMKWAPGTPVTDVADFDSAVEGTTLQDVNDPTNFFRKNADGMWSPSDANGVATSEREISSQDMANNELEFRVSNPSTAAGMNFATRTLRDRGELDFLPTLSMVSFEDPAEGGSYFTRQPDGNWRFVSAVGSTDSSGQVFTPEEFARVIADQRMQAYPSSHVPLIPQLGARAVSARDLQTMPVGTIFTDGLRSDGDGRVFVKTGEGEWTLHNRSGVEQVSGLSDVDVEGMSRISGMVEEEFPGGFSADDAPIGTRILAIDEVSGLRTPFAKTSTGRWARLDGNGNPVWPEISQEDLFDSVDSASVIEFSRPRKDAGDPATIQDIRTAPVGSRIGVTTPEGVSTDFVKTGFDEWSSARSRSPLSESSLARLIADEDGQAVFSEIGNGEVRSADEVGFETSSPDTLRGADDRPVSVGRYVENPQTGVMGMVEAVNVGSGQVSVRDIEDGTLSVVRAEGLRSLPRNPAIDFAQAEGEEVRPTSRDLEIEPVSPDTSSSLYGQDMPSRPALSTYDQPLVPQEWTTAVATAYEAMPANSGRRFEDSPFAPALAALSRRGITESPFVTEGGRRTQPGVTTPTDVFDMISAAGLSSPQDASAARAAFVQNLADVDALDAENAGRMAQHAEDVINWSAANGGRRIPFNAQTFQLKGIGGEFNNYMIGSESWMDATFVSADRLPENQQIALKYAFDNQMADSSVIEEIRSAGPASIQAGYTGFSPETQEIVNALDDAIGQSTFQYDTRVLLTAKMRDFLDSDGRNLSETQDPSTLVGATITDFGYMTPSVDVYPQNESNISDVVLYIRVPGGYNGMWLGGKNSDYGTPNGREVLLPRGTKMFVHRVGGMDSGKTEMYVEIVPIDWFPEASRPAFTESTLTGDTE